jgi:hypothetical protein
MYVILFLWMQKILNQDLIGKVPDALLVGRTPVMSGVQHATVFPAVAKNAVVLEK